MIAPRIPTDVAAIAENVQRKVRRQPLADLSPAGRTRIARIDDAIVYHYDPDPDVETIGEPVLLVPPLAAPAFVFDLRRHCSFVEYLTGQGRPVYLVDYGRVEFRHRAHGMERWVDDIVPRAIEAVVAHSSDPRRRPGRGRHDRSVHLAGWSLGGIFTMLTAAAHPDLPLASVTAIASPFDIDSVPIIAMARPLDRVFGGAVSWGYRTVGGIPAPFTKLAFQVSSIDKYLTKPLAMVMHADDAEFLAQLEAVDHLMNHMYAYPGRSFGQLYHVLMRSNEFATGSMQLAGRSVDLANIDVPVLAVAGTDDVLAPLPSVAHLLDLVTGAPVTRLATAPGGHLGVLTGRRARTTSWPAVQDFWTDVEGPQFDALGA